MKQHTERFKEVITELGKQQDVIITYTIDGKRVELGVEEINSATPRFSSNLLKSVMKELHLDSNVDIPLETEINFKYGLLVDGEFEYLDYGNYIVYSSEKKEDTASYEIVCYDKMLYSMKEYEELAIFYPCTVRSYINAIAGKLGLDFANKNDTFVNYDKELVGDFYLSTDEETQEKKSMGYTYRDVLDDLAEVTASVICINDKDELEVRYITDSINYETTEKSKELKVESEIESQIKILELDGASTQATRSGSNLLPDNYSMSAGGTTPPTVTKLTEQSTPKGLGIVRKITFPANNSPYYSGCRAQTANVEIKDDGNNTYTVSGRIWVKTSMIYNTDYSIYITGAFGTSLFVRNSANDYKEWQCYELNTYKYTEDFSLAMEVIVIYARNTSTEERIIEVAEAQINDGTLVEWEQYGASPSPQFPSEIQSVGDDVNLFDYDTYKQHLNSLVLVENGFKTTKYQNFINKDIDFLEKGETYILSVDIKKYGTNQGTGAIGTIAIRDITNNRNLGYYVNGSAFTIPNDSGTLQLYIYGANPSDNNNYYEFTNIKIQKGTVATPYSEYGKGTVEIKQTGKNLFDKSKLVNNTFVDSFFSALENYKNNNKYATGYVSSGNVLMANPAYSTIFVPLQENENYTFWLVGQGDSKTLSSVVFLDDNGNIISRSSSWLSSAYTHQATTNEKWAMVGLKISDFNDFQVEEGTVATEYEEYKGNNYVIPLSKPLRGKDSAQKDTIEEDGIHRRVRSIVLDSTQNWQINQTTDKYMSFYLYTSVYGMIDYLYFCSHFKQIRIWEEIHSLDEENIWYHSSSSFGIKILKSRLSTPDVAGFKKWLSENNVELIVKLEKEVIEPFTEEQQAVIDSIKTFEGINIINSDAELQIKYPINRDTINEEYLKDTNVTFGEKYGPINAVVLSRSAESDNIYLRDEGSVFSNGLYEIKITDNQIMNQNNRDIYIQDIFDKLKGIEYYLHDLSSTGIMYYNLLDKFDVKIADKIYPIVLFNDEQNISQGLEETLYAELSETTETDYKKAGKDDLKVSLIVDKQNKSINAVVKSNSELEDKTAQLRIDVDRIEGQISETADVTTTGEGYGTVELENINGDSEPIYIRVYPTNEDIISLKPKVGLYPSVGLYPHSREIHFKNTSSQEPYEVTCNIPSDLYQLNDIHDEFILKYETQECYVIHRIGIDKNGNKYVLDLETIEYFDYPVVPLTEGDYQIYTPLSNMAYIYVRLMVQNIYTIQFATKVEVNSKIEQTSNSITSSVNQTLTNYDTKTEVNSKISQTANEINSEVRKKVGNDEIISKINQSAEQVQIDAKKVSLYRKRNKINRR